MEKLSSSPVKKKINKNEEEKKYNILSVFFKKNWWIILISTFVFVCFSLLFLIGFFNCKFLGFLARPKLFFSNWFLLVVFLFLFVLNSILLFWFLFVRKTKFVVLIGILFLFIIFFYFGFVIFNLLWLCVLTLGGVVVLSGLLLYDEEKNFIFLVFKCLSIFLSAIEFMIFYIFYLIN